MFSPNHRKLHSVLLLHAYRFLTEFCVPTRLVISHLGHTEQITTYASRLRIWLQPSGARSPWYRARKAQRWRFGPARSRTPTVLRHGRINYVLMFVGMHPYWQECKLAAQTATVGITIKEKHQVSCEDRLVALIRPRAPPALMVSMRSSGLADLLVRRVRSRDRGPVAHHVNPCTCHMHIAILRLSLCKPQCTTRCALDRVTHSQCSYVAASAVHMHRQPAVAAAPGMRSPIMPHSSPAWMACTRRSLTLVKSLNFDHGHPQ